MSFKKFPGLAEAWNESSPGERVRKLRKAAEGARERLISDGPVAGFATCTPASFETSVNRPPSFR